jgi:putative acetyltransferase
MRTRVERSAEIAVRQVRDDDSVDLIELIGGCYAEYSGCYLDLREEPWLLEPATAYRRWRGRLWVVERDGKVVASGGLRPSGPGMAGVHNLYVARTQRRQGLATRLLELIEAEAAARGAGWARELQDVSHSMEYHFVKPLATKSGRRRF